MTDPELILKKLARIEGCIQEIRALARPERMSEDVRERRFVEHSLQIAVQAAIDAASHVVSDERWGEPRTQREVFDFLEYNGWLSPRLATSLRQMAGFRNVLVHGYDEVDLEVVRDVVLNRLGDLDEFVDTLRRRTGTNRA